MSIATKTLIDHIRIQFSSGEPHQLAEVGDVEGAHLVEIEVFIDEATKKVLGRTGNPKNGLPQVLDPTKVSDLLGKKFAAFAAQLAATQADLDASRRDVAARDAEIADLRAKLTETSAAREDMARRTAAAAAVLSGGGAAS